MTRLNLTDLKQRYAELPGNDRIALTLLALFIAGIVLFSLALLPAHRFANQASADYQQRSELLAWMHAHEAAARAANRERSTDTAAVSPDQSILSLASKQARAQQIAFKRFEPVSSANTGDIGEISGLRVWFDKVPFNNLLQWLTLLQDQHGVQVKQISIDRANQAGLVSAKLEISLP